MASELSQDRSDRDLEPRDMVRMDLQQRQGMNVCMYTTTSPFSNTNGRAPGAKSSGTPHQSPRAGANDGTKRNDANAQTRFCALWWE